ncbi:enoyl-CoA hydratase [Abyssibius alkaniclasticus]|uniref:enoyl-CoA hydratase n=1 Tax=Abyssibius alkaniclasticus TaxID=2881234 RepID=UPI0040580F24
MPDILLRDDADGVTTLTLNTPDKLNALSDEMLAALQGQFDTLKVDTDSRVVILRGAGKAFCAGHDLKQMQAARSGADKGRAYFKDLFERCARVMLAIQALPQPVIAQPHGIATAAGCQLVATCDLALAAEGTRFGVNGVNVGLFCSTPMVALTRNVPAKVAFEMLTTGQFIETSRAERIGLINRAVPLEALEDETMALARIIASKRAAVVKIGKEAFYAQRNMTPAEAYDYAGAVMVENMLFRDTEEGIAAFIDKRPPNWR